MRAARSPVLSFASPFLPVLVALCGAACAPPPSASTGRGGSADSARPDTAGGADSGDAAVVDVAPGPVCRDHDWPVDTAWNVLAAHVVAGQADPAQVDDLRVVLDWVKAGGEPGPWTDAVHGPLLSTNGLDFAGGPPPPVVQQASVPAVTRGPEGDLWLFFVDTNLDGLLAAAEAGRPLTAGLVGVGGLRAARSADGTTFAPVDLTFAGDVPLYVVDPDVRQLPDGRYRMTYFGVPADQACADTLDPAASALPHQAYTAVSTDLVTWTQEGVAFTAENRGSDPTVWCDNDVDCSIFLGGGGASTDGGRTFSAVGMTRPSESLTSPDVFAAPEGGWRMVYLEGTELVSAYAADGRDWLREGTLGVSGADPTVVEVDGTLWMYIKVRGPD